MYLNLGFLETDSDGAVHADGLLRKLLGDTPVRKGGKQHWEEGETNMKHSSVRPQMMLQGALELGWPFIKVPN